MSPQNAPGWRIGPPVSVPRLMAAISAATAAAGPPDEPPGTRARSHGFAVSWNAECSVDEPIANSSMLDFPSGTTPAAVSLVTTVASNGGTQRSRILEPHVVVTPRVDSTSLYEIGTPSSGPSGAPAR